MRRYKPEEFVAAFWMRVTPGPACWMWQGTRTPTGYGRVKRDRRVEATHRVAWELIHGPIPDGLHVLHHCDNPRCVRPDHLFLGTHDANIQDRVAKNRSGALRGAEHPHARFSEADIVAMRAAYAAGTVTIAQMAREHRVTWTAVALAVKGKSWRHL